jgi:hypothetical protein
MTANAETLLLVDLGTANSITISATSGLASASVAGSDFTGALLADFFGSTAGMNFLDSAGSGDLVYAGGASDGSPGLFRATGSAGLNVWSLGGTGSFTAGSQGFTGSATWSVDAGVYAEMLAGNTAGDIYAPADSDDDIGAATLVGQWEIVPAPSSLALLGMGGLVAGRRRR